MIENLDGTMETVNYFGSANVRIYHNEENEAYPLHWHAATEVTMCLEETYEYEIQGNRVHMERGDILWLPAGVLHSISNPANNGSRLIILFDPLILSSFTELSSILSMLSPYYLVSAKDPEAGEIHSILQEIASEILVFQLEDAKFKDVLISAKIIEFAAQLSSAVLEYKLSPKRTKEAQEKDLPQAHLAGIYHICEYMRQHSHEDLTLDHLADKSGFSKYYFSRLFKNFTGMSFIDYLNNIRIEEFEKLILNPEATITDTAFAVGFNSISSFHRVFKKKKGLSPSDYLNLARNYEDPSQRF
jgi:AraC-like DNA-binding protein